MTVFRALFVALLSASSLAGCAVQSSEPVDDETAANDEAVKTSACATVRCAAGTHCVAKGGKASCVPDAQLCKTDADCRLFDNYCDGCACNALSTSSPDPFCSGTTVSCFVQPCMGKAAVCKAGKCAVGTATAGEACGTTTCPSGQVCCNSSCGICTPPGGVCIQIACAPAS